MDGSTNADGIKAVIFDFGGVVHAFDHGVFFRRLARFSPRTAGEMLSIVAASDLPRRYESGLITSSEFFREMAAACDLAIAEEEFVAAFTGIFTPIDTTIRLIRKLAGRYRLALLSNTNAWHFERHIRNVDVFPLFDAVTLSYEVRAMKPGEAIYRDALARLREAPGECVFVDDIAENVAGARRLDIHGVHYTDPDRLESDLRALGMTF